MYVSEYMVLWKYKRNIGLIDGAIILSWHVTEITFTKDFIFRPSFGNLHLVALAISQMCTLPFSKYHVDVTIVVVQMEKSF